MSLSQKITYYRAQERRKREVRNSKVPRGRARINADLGVLFSGLCRIAQNLIMADGQSESFSRVLIDKALEFRGWNLLDAKGAQFEFHAASGRADHQLKKLGLVLRVLLAKRAAHPFGDQSIHV